jgi:hypothetical protein
MGARKNPPLSSATSTNQLAQRRRAPVLHDRQRLIARSRSVPQLDAFLVRQDALPEPEIEKIARHVCIAVN